MCSLCLSLSACLVDGIGAMAAASALEDQLLKMKEHNKEKDKETTVVTGDEKEERYCFKKELSGPKLIPKLCLSKIDLVELFWLGCLQFEETMAQAPGKGSEGGKKGGKKGKNSKGRQSGKGSRVQPPIGPQLPTAQETHTLLIPL